LPDHTAVLSTPLHTRALGFRRVSKVKMALLEDDDDLLAGTVLQETKK
jgi:hypothetical protein